LVQAVVNLHPGRAHVRVVERRRQRIQPQSAFLDVGPVAPDAVPLGKGLEARLVLKRGSKASVSAAARFSAAAAGADETASDTRRQRRTEGAIDHLSRGEG
jgi:hypothetical protein